MIPTKIVIPINDPDDSDSITTVTAVTPLERVLRERGGLWPDTCLAVRLDDPFGRDNVGGGARVLDVPFFHRLDQ